MKALLLACTLMLGILTTHTQAQVHAKEWDGDYTYTHKAGKTTGGSAVNLQYTLMLASPPTPHCSISIYGFQTSEDILCTPRVDAQGLTLLFKEYATGKTTNQYDVAVYKVGAPLLAMSKNAQGQITTTWHQLLAQEDPPRPSGKYFVKKKARR
jgi:hypothetical protein